MHQIRFAPDPARGTHDAPQIPSRMARGHPLPLPKPLHYDTSSHICVVYHWHTFLYLCIYAPPGPRWGSSRRSPDLLVGDIPSPYSSSSTPSAPRLPPTYFSFPCACLYSHVAAPFYKNVDLAVDGGSVAAHRSDQGWGTQVRPTVLPSPGRLCVGYTTVWSGIYECNEYIPLQTMV